MKRNILLLLLLCLLLSGCAIPDGREVSITPHEMQRQPAQNDNISAENYLDLMEALAEMIASGSGERVIQISKFDPDSVDSAMEMAIRYAKEDFPIGAYAVKNIRYEIGTSGGEPALAVTITYNHSQTQIQRIRSVENVAGAEMAILSALEGYDPSIVLLVENYIETDIAQLVEDYALEHPQTIMETPQVTVSAYGTGTRRVLEVDFTYQNSREDLRQMQEQVEPVFDAAKLYVSGDGAARQKFSQLYGFLMERFWYTVETSITPSYSLLRHGVGDSWAFATVYAAMCRSAELECMTITGSCDGQPRTWNLIRIGHRYFHLDLLRCRELGRYREFTDGEMDGYVWDYSAYPEAIDYSRDDDEEEWADAVLIPTEPGPTRPEHTEPSTEPTEPTKPEETTPPTVPEETEPTTKPTAPEETTRPTVPTRPEETTAPTEPEETIQPTEEVTEPTENPAETVAGTEPEETQEKSKIF